MSKEEEIKELKRQKRYYKRSNYAHYTGWFLGLIFIIAGLYSMYYFLINYPYEIIKPSLIILAIGFILIIISMVSSSRNNRKYHELRLKEARLK